MIQGNLWSYSPASDGQRFLVSTETDASLPTLRVITNWQRSAPPLIAQ